MSTITKSARVVGTVWLPLAILALTVAATTWPRTRDTNGTRSAMTARIVAAQLKDVPSHNRLFRASLDLTSDSVWVLRLRTASGTPVRNAGVAIDAWMPEQDSVAHSTSTAVEYSGAGSYRVRPVALDRTGWWNVSVRISAAGRADSLAFNVILD